MRIENINLIGFKSFSEKTTFHFHPGITAIVGPNGCGKSNVVDAFKWVLGEQSAKSLRGDNMEDVIFNGSTAKKPKGMAEVTLVISGVNTLSSEKTEQVSVTRRLYRSGESEYLMNKIPCRLNIS
jgi:chromosome segregation protein